MFDIGEDGWLSPEEASVFVSNIRGFVGDLINEDDLSNLEEFLTGHFDVIPDDVAGRIVAALDFKRRYIMMMEHVIFAGTSLNRLGAGKEVKHNPNLKELLMHFNGTKSGGAKRFRDDHP